MNLPPFFMVFDVESIGLHGDGYAVAYVVIDSSGDERESGVFACDPMNAFGRQDDRAWCAENIPPVPETHRDTYEVREAFFSRWLNWKGLGAVLVADCCWPVEANFLSQCISDNPEARKWSGPYPLHEIASMLLMAGMDPTGSYWEESDGVRHNPLNDARQSARMLRQVLLNR